MDIAKELTKEIIGAHNEQMNRTLMLIKYWVMEAREKSTDPKPLDEVLDKLTGLQKGLYKQDS